MSSPGANRRGIFALIAATAAFSVNDALIKLVSRALPVGEVVFTRGLMTIACLTIAVAATGQLTKIPTAFNRYVLYRSLLDGAATALFVTGLLRIKLADLTAMVLASPLILTALSVLLFKEEVGWRRWTAIVVGFLGALLIVRPVPGSFDAWALMGLGAAFAAATRDLITHRLDPKIPALVIGLAACIAMTLTGALLGINEQWRTPPLHALTLLAGAAALFSIAGYFLVVAFRGVELSVVSPFRYTLLLWGVLAGIVILGEMPDRWSFAGGALIVGSGIYTLHREAVRRRNLTGESPPQ